MSWTIIVDDNYIKHIYPSDEKSQHILEGENELECPCSPTIVDGNIIVHASYDGREGMEEAVEFLKPNKNNP